jgi:hypothetical protein
MEVGAKASLPISGAIAGKVLVNYSSNPVPCL